MTLYDVTFRRGQSGSGPTSCSRRARAGDDVIDRDLILVWAEERRVITGSGILGRLLRGIATPES